MAMDGGGRSPASSTAHGHHAAASLDPATLRAVRLDWRRRMEEQRTKLREEKVAKDAELWAQRVVREPWRLLAPAEQAARRRPGWLSELD